MKIAILLFTCMVSIKFTNAAGATGGNHQQFVLPRGSLVYVGIKGSGHQVAVGTLVSGQPPIWMLRPNFPYQTEEDVYAGVPHGTNFYRFVTKLKNLGINAVIETSCLYIKGLDILLKADLGPVTVEHLGPGYATIFVRLPDGSILGGVPRPWKGQVPDWVVSENH